MYIGNRYLYLCRYILFVLHVFNGIQLLTISDYIWSWDGNFILKTVIKQT